LRRSLNMMAMACLRLVTGLPDRPDLSRPVSNFSITWLEGIAILRVGPEEPESGHQNHENKEKDQHGF